MTRPVKTWRKKPHGNKKSCRNPKKPLIFVFHFSFPNLFLLPSLFGNDGPSPVSHDHFSWHHSGPTASRQYLGWLVALEVITPVVFRGGILGCPRKLWSKVSKWVITPIYPIYKLGYKPFTNHLLISRDIQVLLMAEILHHLRCIKPCR